MLQAEELTEPLRHAPQNPLNIFVAEALQPPAATSSIRDKQTQGVFSFLFALLTEGRGVCPAALATASAADAAETPLDSTRSSICLLRGNNVRRLLAEHLRLQGNGFGSAEAWGKGLRLFVSFVLAESSLGTDAKTELLLSTLRLFFLLLPSEDTPPQKQQPSLDLNILVDFFAECSKGEARKSQARAAVFPGCLHAQLRNLEKRFSLLPFVLQVAGAKVIGMIKAVEERLRLSPYTNLIFDLRLLLAEVLALTHAGVSNRTLQRAETPKPLLDSEQTWQNFYGTEFDDSVQRDECPYTIYQAVGKVGRIKTAESGGAVEVSALGSLQATSASPAAADTSSSVEFARRLEQHASCLDLLELGSSAFRSSLCSPLLFKEFCCRCCLALQTLASCCCQTPQQPQQKRDESERQQPSAAAAALHAKTHSSFNALDGTAKDALRDLYACVGRVTRLAFSSHRCPNCGVAADGFGSDSSTTSGSSNVQQTLLWKLLCTEELWQSWKRRSSFEGALLPRSSDALTPYVANSRSPPGVLSKAPCESSPMAAVSLLNHCTSLAVSALTHPLPRGESPVLSAAAEAAAGKGLTGDKVQQQQQEASAVSGEVSKTTEIEELAVAAAAAIAAANKPAAETAETLQKEAAAAAAAAGGVLPRGKRRKSRAAIGSAAENLEDFYDWLLLWETPAASPAERSSQSSAAPPFPLLQPPPVSLLRQAEEWCLLEDNPPPKNYLELGLTEKLQHKLKDYSLKLQQDADPDSGVGAEEASAANPFFVKRMQRLFNLFHSDRFDLLPLKATTCEGLGEILADIERGGEPRTPPKRDSSDSKARVASSKEASPNAAGAAANAASECCGSSTGSCTPQQHEETPSAASALREAPVEDAAATEATAADLGATSVPGSNSMDVDGVAPEKQQQD
ncbi:hypothetical protein cyc_00072 [Cyclospora cayetanensis]|uniref:Uncharacterized protein n=1 Tax=Cyclospora cayetanensis TaxID=88456 RepID=A0A1D3CXD5_9EIME|nr:hypothetical protein cyc_00072 [Cyclospora cayetanensis]